MSQLNLKKILSSDNISMLVDSLNYNFDQIILNGGGPQGLRGLIGAPGIPGLQGLEGDIGPTGIDGTYIYTSNVDPNSYSFGESLPRNNDIFISVYSSYIDIWQYETEPSVQWNLIGTVTSPAGNTKLIRNTDCIGATDTTRISMSNDPLIAGKVYFGDVLSFDPSIGIINPLDSNKFTDPYSFGFNAFGSPNVLTLGAKKNQLRILCSDPALGLTAGNNFIDTGGGVIHTVEYNSGVLWYKIVNGDSFGQKNLMVDLNTYASGGRKLMIGTTANNLCIGGLEGESLAGRLSVNKSIAIGNSNFYGTAFGTNTGTLAEGIVSEGNLAVGRNQNYLATGAFYGTGGKPSMLLIDVDKSSSASGSKAYLTLSSNASDTLVTYPKNKWSFIYDGYSNVSNAYNFGTLRLLNSEFTSNITGYSLDYLFLKTAAYSGRYKPMIAVGGTVPLSLLDIGTGALRTSIGDINWSPSPTTTGSMTNYLGFNLHRNQVEGNKWTRKGDGTNNSGGCIWNSGVSNFNFSMFTSNAAVDALQTDLDIFKATKVAMSPAPGLYLSENVACNYGTYSMFIADIGATGDLSDPTYNFGRRGVALFGGGLSQSGKGSPYMCDTNGTNFGLIIKPQYTFWGSDYYGMYLAQGNTANGDSGESVGIASNAKAGVHVTPNRVGIHCRTPYERVQIGDSITLQDGNSKVLGFNRFYEISTATTKRILGYDSTDSIVSNLKGAASISFYDSEKHPTTVPSNTGPATYGGQISLEVYQPNNRTSVLSSTTHANGSYAGLKLFAPTSFALNSTYYRNDSDAPKLLIGLDDLNDAVMSDSSQLQKRGTLAIAAQRVLRPTTEATQIEQDDYNLSLYTYDAKPISGISTTKYGKTKEIRFATLSDRGVGIGNTIGAGNVHNDLTWLKVKTEHDDISDIFTTSAPNSRTIAFGSGFKVGINLPSQNVLSLSYSLHVDKHDNTNAAKFNGNVDVTTDISAGGTVSVGSNIDFVGSTSSQKIKADHLKVARFPQAAVGNNYNGTNGIPSPVFGQISVANYNTPVYYDRFLNIYGWSGASPCVNGTMEVLFYICPYKVTDQTASGSNISYLSSANRFVLNAGLLVTRGVFYSGVGVYTQTQLLVPANHYVVIVSIPDSTFSGNVYLSCNETQLGI